MLKKLPIDLTERARTLFMPLDHNLAIESIIAGRTYGEIFVDDVRQPRLALTWTRNRLFLSGDAEDKSIFDALRRQVLDVFYPQCPGAFTFNYAPGWRDVLISLFADQYMMVDIRHYYELESSDFERQGNLDDGFEVVVVNEDLLVNGRLQGLDGVREGMISERSSIEDFLAKSFGYAVVHKGAVVAWCMSEYNWTDRCELGIWTHEAYRRRGLASAAGAAVINHAREIGIKRIGWHCWLNNLASKATAASLGFVLQARVEVFFAHTDPVENLAINGYMSLRAGDARQARQWFEKAACLGSVPPWAEPFMKEANSKSREGNKDV